MNFKSTVIYNQEGFTFLELLIAMLMLGILAAMSAPGMLGLVNRSRVNQAANQVRGAIQEAQRESIKRSKTCELIFGTSGSGANTINTSGGCLVTGSRTLDQVTYRHTLGNNSVINKIVLDFEGLPTNFNEDELFIFQGNGNYQRCLVMSRALGLTRIGTYTTDTSTNISKCSTDEV